MPKNKVGAIKRYLIHSIQKAFDQKAEVELKAEQARMSKEVKKMQDLVKKLHPLSKEYSRLRETIKPKFGSLCSNYISIAENSKVEISMSHKKGITANGAEVSFYEKNVALQCVPEHTAKAKKAIEEINEYCLKLEIGEDITDTETFLKKLTEIILK